MPPLPFVLRVTRVYISKIYLVLIFREAQRIIANILRRCRRDIKSAKKLRLFFQFLCCEYIIHL